MSSERAAFDEVAAEFRAIHGAMCAEFTELTGVACVEDDWTYERGEGGGRSRIFAGGPISKGGINFSALAGAALPSASLEKRPDVDGAAGFKATGISVVIHPENPHIPTMHMNVRFFESGERWWFGGGIDVTPYAPCRGEAARFHAALAELCAAHGYPYADFKRQCDDYFYIPHRREHRGIGGIFFENLADAAAPRRPFALACALARRFVALLRPFWTAAASAPPPSAELQQFQLLRRGRYAEFNLVYDRGTKFGLQSQGRIESILMSLPAIAAWPYNPTFTADQRAFIDFYLQPQDWLAIAAEATEAVSQ